MQTRTSGQFFALLLLIQSGVIVGWFFSLVWWPPTVHDAFKSMLGISAVLGLLLGISGLRANPIEATANELASERRKAQYPVLRRKNFAK